MDAQNSGEYVREAREMLGLSPIEFGVKLGLTRQTIWRYETGDPVPKSVQLAIASLLSEHKKSGRTK